MGKKIAIMAGNLFDAVSGEIIKDAVIKIEGDTIVYSGGRVEIEPEYELINAAGKTVTPGIIDCHAHLCGILKGDTLSRILEPNMQQAMIAVKQAEKILDYGITTVCEVSMAGTYLKKLINEGRLKGPRILPCGQGLAMGGGGPYVDPTGLFPIEFLKENHPWGIPCDGADNLRHEVRMSARKGCDAIKVWSTGGGLNERPRDSDRIYNDEELTAIYEEAEMAGLVVLSHCESLEGTKAALRNGIKCIIHGVELDDEAISLFKEKNAWLMPTFKINLDWVEYYTDEELLRRAKLGEYPGNSLQEKEYNRLLINFKKAYDKGVKIALASDTYCEEETPYGKYTLDEIKTFVNLAGVSEKEAFLAATRYAAEALQIDCKVGTISVGKIADLLIWDENPVEDINCLTKENLHLIMKAGELING